MFNQGKHLKTERFEMILNSFLLAPLFFVILFKQTKLVKDIKIRDIALKVRYILAVAVVVNGHI